MHLFAELLIGNSNLLFSLLERNVLEHGSKIVASAFLRELIEQDKGVWTWTFVRALPAGYSPNGQSKAVCKPFLAQTAHFISKILDRLLYGHRICQTLCLLVIKMSSNMNVRSPTSMHQQITNGNENLHLGERKTYTPLESIQVTGFGIQSTYKMLRSGEMPSIRVGNRFFIPRLALERWLNSCGVPMG